MEDDNTTRITLRLPKPLHAQLQQSADATSKSMNAEIIARLESSFSSSGNNATMLVTIARLNLSLATAELDKQGLQAEAANLALSLQQAAKMLHQYVDESDTEMHAAIDTFAVQAEPFVERIPGLEAELVKKITGMRDAVRELANARGNLMTAFGLAPAATSHVQHSIDDTATAPKPVEPPKRRIRVRRDTKE